MTDPKGSGVAVSLAPPRTDDEIHGEFTSRACDVRGVVRIVLSANMAQHVIVPSLAELPAKHAGPIVDLQVSDALVDMSRDGIDIAIRTGSTQTDEVIAKQISSHGRSLYLPHTRPDRGTTRTAW